ncbi:MAG: redoxin domain-containing protein [Candidatus Latescibacterota bacterium]|jgi:peroxiredoxin|tara:strand:+ start:512 stop:979 length:468 start_codon:yes stop_codon:yes gene_type:complete
MALQVGDKAPDFTLKNADMEEVSLSTQLDQNIVLLFVPLAFTSVCTAEFCDISQGLNGYSELGARVFGISVDSPFSLKNWAEKEGITIPLLSDFNKEVCAAYGAQYDELIGLKGVAKRSAFVIDREGIVRYASISDDAKVLPDFTAVKSCLQGLS